MNCPNCNARIPWIRIITAKSRRLTCGSCHKTLWVKGLILAFIVGQLPFYFPPTYMLVLMPGNLYLQLLLLLGIFCVVEAVSYMAFVRLEMQE